MRRRLTVLERIEKREKKFKGHYGNFQVWAPKVLRIDPEFAARIYRAGKTWEFRKRPLSLSDNIYLFETAPVNAITGLVRFDRIVASVGDSVLDLVKKASCRRLDPPLDKGTRAFLRKWANPYDVVYAHHVVGFKLFSKPILAGVEDARGFWLDAPDNSIEPFYFSFRDGKVFTGLLAEQGEDETHYVWHDPAEAIERFERIRGGKEAAHA